MDENTPNGGNAPSRFALIAGALAATAASVAASTRATERSHPPAGQFVDIDGTAVHYLERGAGPAVVLLHGNGVMAADWEISGVMARLAATHRVIAIDRPGFGYSQRPRTQTWSPADQARLLHAVFAELDIVKPVVVAHSFATLVALALALDYPADVERLVLVSGYYYPTPRLDGVLLGGPAVPVIGDVLRYTISPVGGRLILPLVLRNLFAPEPVDPRFAQLYPAGMSLRPSQLRASAQEALFMSTYAAALAPRYGELRVPAAVLAGDGDRVADPQAQSNRLAHHLAGREAELVAGAGHMLHYFAPERIIAAVENATTPPAPVSPAA